MEQINPRDIVSAQVKKANASQDAGLALEERDGQIYVTKVHSVFEMFTPLEAGCRLLKLQDKDINEYDGIEDVIKCMKDNMSVSVDVFQPKKNAHGESFTSATEVCVDDLEIEVNDVLHLANLNATPELNGMEAKVIKATASGRWVVKVVETGEMLVVENENLEFELQPELVYPVEVVEEEEEEEEEDQKPEENDEHSQ